MLDKVLFKLIGKNKKKLFLIATLQVINFLFTLGASFLFCYVILELINNTNLTSLYYLLLIALFVLFKFLINRIINKIQNDISEEVTINLRKRLLNEIIDNNASIKKYNSQALNQLYSEGVEQLSLYYTVFVPQFFYAMITPIILFIVFSFLSIYVALIFLFFVPLIPVSIILVSKFAKRIFNKYWDKYLSMGDEFLDSIKGLKELKNFDTDKRQLNKLDHKAEEFRKITMKVLVMQLWSTSIMDLVAFGGLAIGIVSSLLFLNSGIIINPYFILFFLLTGAEFFLPMRGLGSAFHLSMNGATAGRKIIDILDSHVKETGEIKLDKINKIVFKDVSINFDTKRIITNLNFAINENGLYGFAGQSGIGKSTILNAIIKDVPLSDGGILINDIDLNSLDLKDFYKKISYLSYDSHLFKGTVRENFLLVNEFIKDEEIKQLLNLVKLEHLSLDYEILEGSTNLSGGEKQRLLIAMYMSRKSDLYIFDEITSNIDIDSENTIINCINELSKVSIILMISHRLANLDNAKFVCFLEKDKYHISKPSNLINDSEIYQKLYMLQKNMKGGYINEKV